MKELQLLETKRTMTSLEIAEITGKEHKNILADVRSEPLTTEVASVLA